MGEKPYNEHSWHKNVVDSIKNSQPNLANYPNNKIFEAWAEWYLSEDNNDESRISDYLELDDLT